MRAHRGILILVFGILGIVSCFPFGIAAWVMGNGDLREMGQGRMDPAGRETTNAGRICGIIATLLALVWCVAAIAILAFSLLLRPTVSPAPHPPRFEYRPDSRIPASPVPRTTIPRETIPLPAEKPPETPSP